MPLQEPITGVIVARMMSEIPKIPDWQLLEVSKSNLDLKIRELMQNISD